MKNFFKKLSFVLAVAMVLTSLTPATASAASKNFVTLKGKDSNTPVTSLYAWIGGLSRNLDYNIGGKTSGVKGTWKSSKTSVVKVDASTGKLTPVANGTATVTFTPSNGKNAVKTTVKVRTRAAALHIYDAAEYVKGGTNVRLEEVTPPAVELKVGDTKELKVTMPLSKKQEKAGAKIASYFTYAEVEDEGVVDVVKDENGNERAYTLTAKAAGETTVTIVANQTTQPNVRYNEYYKQATINVKVTEDTDNTVSFGASQTGAKQIKVTGLEGAAKDDMEVVLKRGSINIPIASKKAEDADTLVLTTAARLQDATYTVEIVKKEASFTGAAEKLDVLAITGEYAVVDNADIREARSAIVPYEAKNQFGEDMNVSLTASSSLSPTVSAKNGIITISINQTSGAAVSLIEGQVVSVSIVSATDGKSAAATVTLSSSSKIKTLKVEGIYNKDNLEFNEDNKDKGAFFLILDAEDQYGYKVVDAKAAKGSLMGVCTNSLIAEMKQENGDLVYESLTINGVKKLGVQIIPKLAGTTNVILTPKYYGGSVQYEATVQSGTKVDTLTFFQPEEAYKGKELLIPVEAVDANGNSITDPKALNDWVDNGSGMLNITNSLGNAAYKKPFEKTANGVLVYNAGNTGTNSIVTVNATTPTYRFASIVVYLKDATTPARIGGISADKVLNLVSGGSVTLGISDFTIYDTDEQVMSAWDFPNDYRIKVTPQKDADLVGASLGISGTSITNSVKTEVTAGAIEELSAPETSKSALIDFTIVDSNGKEVGDAYTATFKNIDLTKLTRAEITAPDQIFAATTEASVTHTRKESLQLIGYCGNDKVIIPGELWAIRNISDVNAAFIQVVTQEGIKGASIGAIENAGTDATPAAIEWKDLPGTNGSKTRSVNIAIAITGSSIAASKVLTASQASPVLTTTGIDYLSLAGKTVTADGNDQFTMRLPKTTNSSSITGKDIIKCLSVKDQYGVDYADYLDDYAAYGAYIQAPVVLITNINGVTVVDNGKNDPNITGLEAGDSFTATITWGTKTITVNVEQR